MTLWPHSYPQNIAPERRDLHDRLPASDLDAVTKRPAAGNGLQYGELFRSGNGSARVCRAGWLLAERRSSEKNEREKSER
jgi:hypothetical protein